MAIIFVPRKSTPYTAQSTTSTFTPQSTSSKFIVYDGIRNNQYYAYDDDYKKYYVTSTGEVDKKYVKRTFAYEATQNGNKLKIR